MNIHLGAGIGSGPNQLSAFDTALNSAGIANYNLLLLSSVIPPKSNIIEHDGHIEAPLPGDWGDRLYLVMAQAYANKPGAEAWAGIGWVQDSGTGKGLFVEHEGVSEQEVRDDIQKSLQTLMETRDVDFGPIHMKITGTTCKDRPVCAMTVAVYQASDWHNKPMLCDQEI